MIRKAVKRFGKRLLNKTETAVCIPAVKSFLVIVCYQFRLWNLVESILVSCAVFESCCILVECRSPVVVWHLIFCTNTPRSWNFCCSTWMCWMVIFYKIISHLEDDVRKYIDLLHSKKWKQKLPEESQTFLHRPITVTYVMRSLACV